MAPGEEKSATGQLLRDAKINTSCLRSAGSIANCGGEPRALLVLFFRRAKLANIMFYDIIVFIHMKHTLNRTIHCATLSFVVCAISVAGLVSSSLLGSITSSAGSSLISVRETAVPPMATVERTYSVISETGGRYDTDTMLFMGILIFLLGFVVHAFVVIYRKPVNLSQKFLRSRVYLPGRLAARFYERRV